MSQICGVRGFARSNVIIAYVVVDDELVKARVQKSDIPKLNMQTTATEVQILLSDLHKLDKQLSINIFDDIQIRSHLNAHGKQDFMIAGTVNAIRYLNEKYSGFARRALVTIKII